MNRFVNYSNKVVVIIHNRMDQFEAKSVSRFSKNFADPFQFG